MPVYPTEIAYKAWLNTERPISYHTRDGKGKDITTMVDLLPPEANKDYDHGAEGECAICGGRVSGGVPVKKMLGSSYTDWHLHKSPHSPWVCKNCAWSMMMNVPNGRQILFRYSFFASDEGLELCNRAELRNRLTNPPEPPFVAVIAVSQKKHLATKASVSYDPERYYCMLEEECVPIVRAEIKHEIMLIEALRGLGCVREEIENASFRFDKMRAWGAENLERIVAMLLPHIRKRQFKIALHVAQKMEDEDLCKSCLDFRHLT